jgi:hypothetical protein
MLSLFPGASSFMSEPIYNIDLYIAMLALHQVIDTQIGGQQYEQTQNAIEAIYTRFAQEGEEA